jgi:hypothetical protein
MINSIRRFGSVLALIAVLLVCQTRLLALPPTVLMFYGAPLKKPILVTGTETAVFTNLLDASRIGSAETISGSYISVALFWGPPSDPAVNRVPVAQLTPQMAWQHGRYYVATASRPAMLLVTQMSKGIQAVPPETAGKAFIWGGQLSADAVAVLKRLGIPTR